MNSVYCTSCGAKIEYSYPKPKFCSSCGTSMSPEVSQMPSKSSAAQSQTLQEDETNVERVPNINQLSYDVDYGMPNIIKGKEIIENPSAPAPRISRAPSNKSNATQSEKDVIMESMQACRNQGKPTELNG